MASTLIVEIQEDGTVKLNARDMVGTEKELVAALDALAKEVGGSLEVEKHVPGVHHEHHGTTGHHHKVGK
jgi:hypothetical protein